MTPHELKTARKALGMTAAALGRALELEGRDPGRTIRLWEEGRHMPGPARVAVRLMLAEQARQSLQDAIQEAQAIITPANPPAPVLDALDALEAQRARNRHPVTTRRRG